MKKKEKNQSPLTKIMLYSITKLIDSQECWLLFLVVAWIILWTNILMGKLCMKIASNRTSSIPPKCSKCSPCSKIRSMLRELLAPGKTRERKKKKEKSWCWMNKCRLILLVENHPWMLNTTWEISLTTAASQLQGWHLAKQAINNTALP